MSSLLGVPTDRWSLARAADALGESARQVARPGLAWLVGLFYPSVFVAFAHVWPARPADRWIEFGPWVPDGRATAPTPGAIVEELAWAVLATLALVVLGFPFSRMVAGLARVGTRSAWERASAPRGQPRLATLWSAGAGLTWPVVGLWTQFLGLLLGAGYVLLLPAIALSTHLRAALHGDAGPTSILAVSVLGLVAVVGVGYVLALSTLTQLALHSLAHNRRGVGSALLHAWRIARHDGWATVRAVAVDLVLTVVFDALVVTAKLALHHELGTMLVLVVWGFVGCVRCAYWARAYRALGGLSPDDGVPGL